MPRIGETPCCNPACACTDATVNRTGGGKLQSKCHKCGTERWAPLGTKAHRDLMAQTVLDEGAAPEPAPAPEPRGPVPPAPEPKKRVNSAFSLGNL